MALGGRLFVTPDPEVVASSLPPGEKAAGKRRAETDPGETARPEKRRAQSAQTDPAANTRPVEQVRGCVTFNRSTVMSTVEQQPVVKQEPREAIPVIRNQVGETVDLSKTHLTNVNVWAEEGEELATLQQMFSDGLEADRDLAIPGTEAHQRLGDASASVLQKNASDILKSYKRYWRQDILDLKANLEAEIRVFQRQFNGKEGQIQRPQSRALYRQGLQDCKRRLEEFEEITRTRQKVAADLQQLDGADA